MEIAKLFTKKTLIIFIVALNIIFIAFYNSVTDYYFNLELFGLMTDEDTEEYNIDDIKFDYEINQDSLVKNQNFTFYYLLV